VGDCLRNLNNSIVILFIFLCSTFSDTVYEVPISQADLKVFITKARSEADYLIRITQSKSLAKNQRLIWYFTRSKSRANLHICYVKNKSQADVIIYFVK